MIPTISNKELKKRARQIKPLVRDGEGCLRRIKTKDKVSYLRGIAYKWDPKLKARVKHLVPMGRIVTLHSYGHPSLFKPSVAEVIAQIPKSLIDDVKGFEIVDFNLSSNEGYHSATTVLYRKEG